MGRKLGAVLMAACMVGAAGCGGEDGENTGRFDGSEQEVATVVDQLGEAAREGDVKTICEDLVTPALQKSVRQASGTSCGDEFRENIVSDDAKFRVESVTVDGDSAEAVVVDQADRESRMGFVRNDGEWRIARVQ